MVNGVLQCVHISNEELTRKGKAAEEFPLILEKSMHCECFNLEVVVIINTRNRQYKSSVIFKSSARRLNTRN